MGVGQAVQAQTCQRPKGCSNDYCKYCEDHGKARNDRSFATADGEKVFLQDGKVRHWLCVETDKKDIKQGRNFREAVLVPHVVRKHLVSSFLVAYGAGGLLHLVMLALDRSMQPAPLPADSGEMWVWWLSCATSMVLALLGLITVFNSTHLATPLADGIYCLENAKGSGKFLNYAQYSHSATQLHGPGLLHTGYKSDPLKLRDQASESDHNHFRIKVVAGDIYTLQCIKWEHHYLGVDNEGMASDEVKVLNVEVEEDDAEEKKKYRWKLKQVDKKVFRPAFYLENVKTGKRIEVLDTQQQKGSAIPNGASIGLGRNDGPGSQWVFEAVAASDGGRASDIRRSSRFSSFGRWPWARGTSVYGPSWTGTGSRSLEIFRRQSSYFNRGVGSRYSWPWSGTRPVLTSDLTMPPAMACGMDSTMVEDLKQDIRKEQDIADDVCLSSQLGLPRVAPGRLGVSHRGVAFDLEDGRGYKDERVQAICTKCGDDIVERPVHLQDGKTVHQGCLDREKKYTVARLSACGRVLADPHSICAGCRLPIDKEHEVVHIHPKDKKHYHFNCLDVDTRREWHQANPGIAATLHHSLQPGVHPPLAATTLGRAGLSAYTLPSPAIDYYDRREQDQAYQDGKRRDLLMAQDKQAKQVTINSSEAERLNGEKLKIEDEKRLLAREKELVSQDRDHQRSHHKHGHHKSKHGHHSSSDSERKHRHHSSSDSEGRHHTHHSHDSDHSHRSRDSHHSDKKEKKDKKEKRREKKEKKEKKDKKDAKADTREPEAERSEDDLDMTNMIPFECSQSFPAFEFCGRKSENSSGWRGTKRCA